MSQGGGATGATGAGGGVGAAFFWFVATLGLFSGIQYWLGIFIGMVAEIELQ
jgi:hypothetical protein